MLRSLKIPRRNLKVVFRYLTEIIIIFIGITISFAFEQWREDERQKDSLIELTQSLLNDTKTAQQELMVDLEGSEMWIANMDTIQTLSLQKKLSIKQLQWFYGVITGQEIFLFKPYSPTYSSASNTTQWSQLPDTIRAEIYRVYQQRLRFLSLLYDQQQENITHFRLAISDPGALHVPLTNAASMSPDYNVFSEMITQTNCQNLIHQILITEKLCLKGNQSTIDAIVELENDLEEYLKLLRDS